MRNENCTKCLELESLSVAAPYLGYKAEIPLQESKIFYHLQFLVSALCPRMSPRKTGFLTSCRQTRVDFIVPRFVYVFKLVPLRIISLIHTEACPDFFSGTGTELGFPG